MIYNHDNIDFDQPIQALLENENEQVIWVHVAYRPKDKSVVSDDGVSWLALNVELRNTPGLLTDDDINRRMYTKVKEAQEFAAKQRSRMEVMYARVTKYKYD